MALRIPPLWRARQALQARPERDSAAADLRQRPTRHGYIACRFSLIHHFPETDMGKYFIGWLLGVPAIALVLLYLIFH